MGARRGAGRSAARGRAIRADDCEKAACSTSAARGCSKWIAAVAPATRARPELASERRAARAAIVDGDGLWGEETSPRRGRTETRDRGGRSARRAAAAPWGILRAKLLGTGYATV